MSWKPGRAIGPKPETPLPFFAVSRAAGTGLAGPFAWPTPGGVEAESALADAAAEAAGGPGGDAAGDAAKGTNDAGAADDCWPAATGLGGWGVGAASAP